MLSKSIQKLLPPVCQVKIKVFPLTRHATWLLGAISEKEEDGPGLLISTHTGED